MSSNKQEIKADKRRRGGKQSSPQVKPYAWEKLGFEENMTEGLRQGGSAGAVEKDTKKTV